MGVTDDAREKGGPYWRRLGARGGSADRGISGGGLDQGGGGVAQRRTLQFGTGAT